jgi:hypothetical protein
MSLKKYLSPFRSTKSLLSQLYSRPAFSFSSEQKNKNPNESEFQKRETEFIKKSNVDVEGVYINKDNIARKPGAPRIDRELPLKHYQIKKPGQYYDPATTPNPTQNVFNFHEDVLLQKSK